MITHNRHHHHLQPLHYSIRYPVKYHPPHYHYPYHHHHHHHRPSVPPTCTYVAGHFCHLLSSGLALIAYLTHLSLPPATLVLYLSSASALHSPSHSQTDTWQHGCERSAECQFEWDGSLVPRGSPLLCSLIIQSLCVVYSSVSLGSGAWICMWCFKKQKLERQVLGRTFQYKITFGIAAVVCAACDLWLVFVLLWFCLKNLVFLSLVLLHAADLIHKVRALKWD